MIILMVITSSRFHYKIADNKISFDLAEGLKETSSTYFTKTKKWDPKDKIKKFRKKIPFLHLPPKKKDQSGSNVYLYFGG
jgi:hypothetical protein